jgi:hypothetical protein
MTRVLPEPGPARIRLNPSGAVAAVALGVVQVPLEALAEPVVGGLLEPDLPHSLGSTARADWGLLPAADVIIPAAGRR